MNQSDNQTDAIKMRISIEGAHKDHQGEGCNSKAQAPSWSINLLAADCQPTIKGPTKRRSTCTVKRVSSSSSALRLARSAKIIALMTLLSSCSLANCDSSVASTPTTSSLASTTTTATTTARTNQETVSKSAFDELASDEITEPTIDKSPSTTGTSLADEQSLDERLALVSAAATDQPPTPPTPEARLGVLEPADERLIRNRKSASNATSTARASSLLMANATSGGTTESAGRLMPTLSSTLDYDDFDLDYQLKLNTSSSPLGAEYQSPFLPESQPLVTGSNSSVTSDNKQTVWPSLSQPNSTGQYFGSGSSPILPSLLTVKSTQLTSQELDSVRPQFAIYQPEPYDSSGEATEQSLLAQGDLLATASNAGAPLGGSIGSVIRLNGSHVDLRDNTPTQQQQFQSAIARLRLVNASRPIQPATPPVTTIVVDSSNQPAEQHQAARQGQPLTSTELRLLANSNNYSSSPLGASMANQTQANRMSEAQQQQQPGGLFTRHVDAGHQQRMSTIPAGYYAASVQRQPASPSMATSNRNSSPDMISFLGKSPAKLVASSSSQRETYAQRPSSMFGASTDETGSGTISDEDMSTYVAQLASFSTPLAAAAAAASSAQPSQPVESFGSSNWMPSPSNGNQTEGRARVAGKPMGNLSLDDLELLVQQLIELSLKSNSSGQAAAAQDTPGTLKASPTRMLISSHSASGSPPSYYNIEGHQREQKREREQQAAASELHQLRQQAFIEALRASITRPFERQPRPEVTQRPTLRPPDDEEWQSSNTTETVAVQSAFGMPSFNGIEADSSAGQSSRANNGATSTIGQLRGSQMSPPQTLLIRTPTGSLLRAASMLVMPTMYAEQQQQQQQVPGGRHPAFAQQQLAGGTNNAAGYQQTRPSGGQPVNGQPLLTAASNSAQGYQFNSQAPGKLLADRFPFAAAPAYLIKLPTLTGGTITAAGSLVPPARLLRNRPLRLLGATFSPPRLRLVSSGMVQPAGSSLSTLQQVPPFPLNTAFSTNYQKLATNPMPAARYQGQQLDLTASRPYSSEPEMLSAAAESPNDSEMNQNANPITVTNLLSQQQLPQQQQYYQASQSPAQGQTSVVPQAATGQQQAAALSRLQQATYSLVELTSLASLVDEMVGGSDIDSSPMAALAQAINNLSQQGLVQNSNSHQSSGSLNTQASTTSGQSANPIHSTDSQAVGLSPLSLRGLLDSAPAWRDKQLANRQRELALTLERLLLGANTKRPAGRIRVKYVRVPVAVYESPQADGLEASLLVPTKNQLMTKSQLAELVASSGMDSNQNVGSTPSVSQPPNSPDPPTQPTNSSDPQTIQSSGQRAEVQTTKTTSVTPPQSSSSSSLAPAAIGTSSTQASSNDYLFDELGSEHVPQVAANSKQLSETTGGIGKPPPARWTRKLTDAELKAIESAVYYSLMGAPSSSLIGQLTEPAKPTTTLVPVATVTRDKTVALDGERHGHRKGRKSKIQLDEANGDDLDSAGSQSTLANSLGQVSKLNGGETGEEDDRITSKDLPIIESLISSLIHGPKPTTMAPPAAPFYHPYAGYPMAAAASQPYPAFVPYMDPYWRPAYMPASGLRAEPSSSYESYTPSIGHHHHHVGPLARPRFSLGEVMGALGARKLISSLLSRRKRARNSKRRAVQQASGANRLSMGQQHKTIAAQQPVGQPMAASNGAPSSYFGGRIFMGRHHKHVPATRTTSTSTMSSLMDGDEPVASSQPLRIWYPTNPEHELTTPSSVHRLPITGKRVSVHTKTPLSVGKHHAPAMHSMHSSAGNRSAPAHNETSLSGHPLLTKGTTTTTTTTTTTAAAAATTTSATMLASSSKSRPQVPMRRTQLDQEILLQSLQQQKKLMTLEPKPSMDLASKSTHHRGPSRSQSGHRKYRAPQLFTNNHNHHQSSQPLIRSPSGSGPRKSKSAKPQADGGNNSSLQLVSDININGNSNKPNLGAC